jgi:hypothetical protein
VGLGAPEGAGKPLGGEPDPIGKGGATPVGCSFAIWMGDAAARVKRAATRMDVACMLASSCLLFGVEDRRLSRYGCKMFDELCLVGSDSCVLIEVCCVDVQMVCSSKSASRLRSYKDGRKG